MMLRDHKYKGSQKKKQEREREKGKGDRKKEGDVQNNIRGEKRQREQTGKRREYTIRRWKEEQERRFKIQEGIEDQMNRQEIKRI